jgi:hypothetical protein
VAAWQALRKLPTLVEASPACTKQQADARSAKVCRQLEIARWPRTWELLGLLTTVSRSFGLGELNSQRDTNGNSTHQFWVRPLQASAFKTIILKRQPRVLCEIGFNAGHSSSVWLEDTAVEEAHLFDMFDHTYSAGMRDLVASVFPGKAHFHAGNSIETVAEFARRVKAGEQRRCDLWYIDGGHTGRTPKIDLKHALQASHNGTIMLFDDCSRKWGAVYNAFNEGLRDGTIRLSSDQTALPRKTFFGAIKNGWCGAEANVAA